MRPPTPATTIALIALFVALSLTTVVVWMAVAPKFWFGDDLATRSQVVSLDVHLSARMNQLERQIALTRESSARQRQFNAAVTGMCRYFTDNAPVPKFTQDAVGLGWTLIIEVLAQRCDAAGLTGAG